MCHMKNKKHHSNNQFLFNETKTKPLSIESCILTRERMMSVGKAFVFFFIVFDKKKEAHFMNNLS